MLLNRVVPGGNDGSTLYKVGKRTAARSCKIFTVRSTHCESLNADLPILLPHPHP